MAEIFSSLREFVPEYGSRGSLTDNTALLSDQAQRSALLEQYGSVVEPYDPSLGEKIYNFAFDALGGNTATGVDRQRVQRWAGYPQKVIDQTGLAAITDYSQAKQDFARGDALSGTTNLAMAATSFIPGQQRQAAEEISNRLLKGIFGRTLDTSNTQIPFRSPISPQTDVPQIPFRSDTPAQGQPALRNLTDAPVTNPSALRDTPNIIGDEPLPGAPQVANIPNLGPYRFGPNPDVEKAAQNYAQMTGMPYTPVQVYSPLDVERAERIAKEYGLMKHDPSSPQVQQAYGALMNELMGQYDSLRKAGYKFVFDENAYRNSPYESLIDIAQNKTLRVYPTSAGFGSGGGADFDVATNPLLAQSGEYFNGIPATYNDIFRAVHDVYGHAKPGVGFRAAGEENAFLSHAAQLSPTARRALTTETRGQNNFLNFGPDGETNRSAGIDDTVFAPQKTGVLPRWATESGRPETLMRRDDFFQNLSNRGETLEGALADDGSIILTHYSNKELDRVDPDFYGSKGYRSTGDERRRRASPDWVNRSYWGIQGAQNPYQREAMLGTLKHETKIDPELLYDPRANKEKLWSDSDITGSEKKIADNNYSGYYLDHPQLGKVAVVFDPLDVTKKYLIPIGAVGVSAAAIQESKETKDNT